MTSTLGTGNATRARAQGVSDRPCAATGLTSYRAKSRYGWIMIGAKDDEDAAVQALRSTSHFTDLQIWTDAGYAPITPKPGVTL